ncbi:uncharacterized protein L201_007817 [Kwoniella dendrophila CBS 6074]|uniref:Uncharacterized protein n=1 Tax=Kwoniella dendrophila CBS 6074 TaxID=1295534 RepID=A0AAX4K5E7_9TREE
MSSSVRPSQSKPYWSGHPTPIHFDETHLNKLFSSDRQSTDEGTHRLTFSKMDVNHGTDQSVPIQDHRELNDIFEGPATFTLYPQRSFRSSQRSDANKTGIIRIFTDEEDNTVSRCLINSEIQPSKKLNTYKGKLDWLGTHHDTSNALATSQGRAVSVTGNVFYDTSLITLPLSVKNKLKESGILNHFSSIHCSIIPKEPKSLIECVTRSNPGVSLLTASRHHPEDELATEYCLAGLSTHFVFKIDYESMMTEKVPNDVESSYDLREKLYSIV